MGGWFRVWKDTLNDPSLLTAIDSLVDDEGWFFGIDAGGNELVGAYDQLEGDENRNALRNAVVGALVTLWAYADDHIADDNTIPLTAKALDRLVGLPGFHRICPAKWLVIDAEKKVIRLPGFREKNALETKDRKRELNAERQRRYRERQREDDGDESNALRNAESNVTRNTHNAPRLDKTKTKQKEELPAEVVDVFDHWKEVHNHPRAKLDDKRKAVIRKALKSYSADDLKLAIQGCKHSDFHQGKNDSGVIYDALSLILRDGDKIDKFIALASGPKHQPRGFVG